MVRSDLLNLFAADSPLQESSFATLINSMSHPEDIVTDLTATATNSDLKLASGSAVFSLNTSLVNLTGRVDSLENAETTFYLNYYTQSEVDSKVAVMTATANAVATQLSTSLVSFQSLYYDKTEVDALLSALDLSYDISEISGLQAALDEKATVATVASNLNYILGLLAGKSDNSHDHDSVYLKKTDANFASSADLETKSPLTHYHSASEVSGLDIYQTEAEVLSQIVANSHTLDDNVMLNAILESHYEKVEVDELFRVKLVQYPDMSQRLSDLEAVPAGTADAQLRSATSLLISQLYGFPYSTAIASMISASTYVADGYMKNQTDYVVGGNMNYMRLGM